MPTTNFFHPMYVHVDIKKILNKNKNIFEKMSEYLGFSPPTHILPTYATVIPENNAWLKKCDMPKFEVFRVKCYLINASCR